jgi:LysM repeat protein
MTDKTEYMDAKGEPTRVTGMDEGTGAPTPPNAKADTGSRDGDTSKTKLGQGTVSTGTMAAAAAGTGAVGVAGGAAFASEITDAFTPSMSGSPDVVDGAEAEEVDVLACESVETEGENPTISGSTTAPIATGPVDAEAMEPELPAGEMHFAFNNDQGCYEVSFADMEGDGVADTMTMHAQLVDGSTVSFTASGTVMDQLFQEPGVGLATPTDYLQNVSNASFPNFTPESLGAVDYDIQSGDTLSEIAAAHQTTIVHIMELNPHITDANVIYSGDSIVVPMNDHASNPYAGWSPSDTYEQLDEHYAAEVQGAEEYAEVDWASFEDPPVEEYQVELVAEDFDHYEVPESYLSDSNLLDSLGFC